MPFGAEPLVLTEEGAVVGGWSCLSEDPGFAGHYRSDDCALETSLLATSHHRSDGGVTSWPAAVGADTKVAGRGAGCDSGRTEGWLHPLVVPEAGEPGSRWQRCIRVDSKTARPFKWKCSDVRRRIVPCKRIGCDGHWLQVKMALNGAALFWRSRWISELIDF